jgi:hypothetical protein
MRKQVRVLHYVMPAYAGNYCRLYDELKENLDAGLRRQDDMEESTTSRRIQNRAA